MPETYQAFGTPCTYVEPSWVQPGHALDYWPDSRDLNPETVTQLVTIATDQLRHYAPVLPDDEEVPGRYAYAVILQARELWAASQRGEQDVIGIDGDSQAIRARPLTAAVKQLLRPEQRVPVVG